MKVARPVLRGGGNSDVFSLPDPRAAHGAVVTRLGDTSVSRFIPMPIPERYNRGYNLGVGGAVVRDNRLLLVRRASRRGRGNWQVPGGFVEPDETIERAVVREVREEAGVTGEVQGVIGLRNRCDPDIGNSLYIVLLMKPLSGEPTPDMEEVDRAEYLTLEQIEQLEQVPPINREIASRVLSEEKCLLAAQELIHLNGKPYTLFVG